MRPKARVRVSAPPARLPLQFERILLPRAPAMAAGSIVVDFPSMGAACCLPSLESLLRDSASRFLAAVSAAPDPDLTNFRSLFSRVLNTYPDSPLEAQYCSSTPLSCKAGWIGNDSLAVVFGESNPYVDISGQEINHIRAAIVLMTAKIVIAFLCSVAIVQRILTATHVLKVVAKVIGEVQALIIFPVVPHFILAIFHMLWFSATLQSLQLCQVLQNDCNTNCCSYDLKLVAQIPVVSFRRLRAGGMVGYPEDNQHAMNGYEEEEEVEEVDEEEGHPGRRGGRDGGDGVGYGDAGGEDGRAAAAGDSSGKIFVGGVAWETTEEYADESALIPQNTTVLIRRTAGQLSEKIVLFSSRKVVEDGSIASNKSVVTESTYTRHFLLKSA